MEYMLGVFKRSPDIMRNHDDGNPFLSVEFFNKSIHFYRSLRIQSGNRFIQENHFLRGTERTRKQYPLLLSAGKFPITAPG